MHVHSVGEAVLKPAAFLGAVLILAPAAAAQQAAYVVLPGASERSISFVDLGSVRRGGMDAEVRALQAYAQPLGEEHPVKGFLQTWRVSCDWNSIVMAETASLGPEGEALSSERPERAMNFVPPDGAQARIAEVACAQRAPPAAALPSVKEALAEAARLTVRPPPVDPSIPTVVAAPVRMPEPSGPIVFASHPEPKRKQYGLVRLEHATGNALYLDWGNFRKTNGKVLTIMLELLGEVPLPSQDSRMKVSSVELDCGARTVAVLAYTSFGRLFLNRRKEDRPSLPRAAAGWPLGSELLNAACKGRKPRETFYSEYDADKFVEQARK